MSLQNYSQEELENTPMIDLANLILFEEKEAIHFKDIFEKIAEIKGFSDEQKKNLIAQFYTDLNIDGRFITTGANLWGLKRLFPVDQIDEQVSNPSLRTKETEEDEDLDIVDEDMDDLIEGFDEEDEEEEIEEDEFPAYKDEDDE